LPGLTGPACGNKKDSDFSETKFHSMQNLIEKTEKYLEASKNYVF
jgi:hypothetical protein